MRQYGRAAAAAMKITGWLRQQGWDAEAATGAMAGKILMIPPALECGFGELGKHGSLINPEFGASFGLSAVLTNTPIAIAPDKQRVRGETRLYVDFDKCIPYFAEHSGCAICIAECPWSQPGVGVNLAAKLAKRAAREAEQGP